MSLGFLATSLVFAATLLPVQGVMTDADGAPLHGTRAITVTLDAPGAAVHPIATIPATVAFQDGAFSAALPVDLASLANAVDLTVAITVDGVTSAPVEVGWAPLAAWAHDAGRLGGTPAASWATDAEVSAAVASGVGAALTGLGSGPGVNTASNAVAWAQLKGVPAGLADGVDADTLYTNGTGITLSSGQFAVDTTWMNANYVARGVGGAVSLGSVSAGSVTATGSVQPGASSATCDSSLFGAFRTASGTSEVCTTVGWVRVADPRIGNANTNPGVSCNQIHAADPSLPTGLYWIDPDGAGTTTPVAQVLCDMTTDGGGFTLVWKFNEDVAGEPGAIWTSGSLNPTNATLATRARTTSNYAYPLHKVAWSSISEVRLELLKGATAVRAIRFDARGTNDQSWFADGRIIASPWLDVAFDSKNVFTIATSERQFHINQTYGGCPADAGWLTINGARSSTCSWEGNYKIMFAPGDFDVNWTSGGHWRADAAAIWVR